MTVLRNAALGILVTVLIAGCTHTAPGGSVAGGGARGTTEVGGDDVVGGKSAVLEVRGLSCPLCASNIDKQLLQVDGVSGVVVNIGKGEAILALDGSGRTTRTALTRAVHRSGFTLVSIKILE